METFTDIGLAQRQRAWLITRRSDDRNIYPIENNFLTANNFKRV